MSKKFNLLKLNFQSPLLVAYITCVTFLRLTFPHWLNGDDADGNGGEDNEYLCED